MTRGVQAIKDYDAVARHRAMIARIRDLIVLKIDHATAHFVQNHDRNTNRKDNTCQITVSRRGVGVGVWVNVGRNLRLKQIEHRDLGVSSDIPRGLVLALVGVRFLHLRQDPLSPFEAPELLTVGGVLFAEVLDVPEKPRMVKARVPDIKDAGLWAMMRLTDRSGTLCKQQYPAVDPLTGQLQPAPPMQARTIRMPVCAWEG